jgi:phage FluMu protein Com
MPTPHSAHNAAQTRWPERIPVTPEGHLTSDWRCSGCGKLLGVRRDGRMHLRFGRGHEYLVGFPVVATCRGCRTLNQATAPAL